MESFRDEGDADAFDFVRAGRAALEDGALRFDGDSEDAAGFVL